MKKLIIGAKYRVKNIKDVNKYINKNNVREWSIGGYQSLASKFITITGFMNDNYEIDGNCQFPKSLINLDTKLKVPRNITILIYKLKREFKYLYFSSVGPGAGSGGNTPIGEVEIHPMVNPNNKNQYDIILIGRGFNRSFKLIMSDNQLEYFMETKLHKHSFDMTQHSHIRQEYELIKEDSEKRNEFEWERR